MPSVFPRQIRFVPILISPRVTLDKACFAECPINFTRQSVEHSSKSRILVVMAAWLYTIVKGDERVYNDDDGRRLVDDDDGPEDAVSVMGDIDGDNG
jgi:hypothetical protein